MKIRAYGFKHSRFFYTLVRSLKSLKQLCLKSSGQQFCAYLRSSEVNATIMEPALKQL